MCGLAHYTNQRRTVMCAAIAGEYPNLLLVTAPLVGCGFLVKARNHQTGYSSIGSLEKEILIQRVDDSLSMSFLGTFYTPWQILQFDRTDSLYCLALNTRAM